MIFVTVGTHEQDFKRLWKEIDNLIDKKIIRDEIFAQIGYTNYKPKNYKFKEMLSFKEMNHYCEVSDIIITHGGPGSIFQALEYGKIPIVVPRNPEFNEHVDNHQILFARKLEKDRKIIALYEIDKLGDRIDKYNYLVKNLQKESTNNEEFILKFEKLVDDLFKGKG